RCVYSHQKMYWKSARLMPLLRSAYCGICRYFANSAAQSAADSGGNTPVTGRHSVIDRPDKVSRVTPPSTTITKIQPQQRSSQYATAGSARPAAAAVCAAITGDNRLIFAKDRMSGLLLHSVRPAARRVAAEPAPGCRPSSVG